MGGFPCQIVDRRGRRRREKIRRLAYSEGRTRSLQAAHVKLGRQAFKNYNSVPNDYWTHDPSTESFSRSLPLRRPSPESVYVVPTAHHSEILLRSSQYPDLTRDIIYFLFSQGVS